MPAHADRSAEAAKGGVRFQPSEPIPDQIVESLVRARLAEVDAALAKRPG